MNSHQEVIAPALTNALCKEPAFLGPSQDSMIISLSQACIVSQSWPMDFEGSSQGPQHLESRTEHGYHVIGDFFVWSFIQLGLGLWVFV